MTNQTAHVPLDPATLEALTIRLLDAPLYHFNEWPSISAKVPAHVAGVYAVFRNEEFLYVGMARISSRSPDAKKRENGLRGRLGKHAYGYHGGNKFAIYICERYVIPALLSQCSTIEDVRRFEETLASGGGNLDQRTGGYIRSHLSFQCIATETSQVALALEEHIKTQGIRGTTPVINGRRLI